MAINENTEVSFYAVVISIKHDTISTANFDAMLHMISQAIVGVGLYNGGHYHFSTGDHDLFFESLSTSVDNINALAQIIYPIVKERCHGKFRVSFDGTGNQDNITEF
jgi:hypothetical protein